MKNSLKQFHLVSGIAITISKVIKTFILNLLYLEYTVYVKVESKSIKKYLLN